MAYSMYNNNSNKRGYFYDVRNYGMHPMEMVEYQRGRPTKLPLRTLNRQFKETAIQLNDQTAFLPLTISVQICKVGKQQQQQPCLVLSNSDDAAATTEVTEIKTAGGTICVPEASAIRLIMRLRKLAKWKPTASGGLPSAGLGLSFEDTVFKAQVVNLAAAGSDESQEAPKQFSIKVLAESRSKDPQERKELASVLVPMEPGSLDKLQSALSKLVVTESPLYHTASLQCSDGSKIYLDLIRDATTHYLKISQVTRDFRSIINVPADEVEGLVDVLSTSLKATKDQKQQQQTCLAQSNSVDRGGFTAASLMTKVIKDQQPGAEGKSSAAGKRKRGRNPRRRPGDNRRRRDAADTTAATAGAATSASVEDEAAAKTSGSQSSDGDEKENVAASEAVNPKQQQPDSSEDSLTVESRPVENGDGCDKTTTVE